ncbi:MAG: protein translocase subunit SecD [Patescibacteria group bacterium]
MLGRTWAKLFLILVLAGFLALIDLPVARKEFLQVIPVFGEELAELKVKLGLDLQGGAHLDYRVVTKDIPEIDIPKIVAGVKEVMERRVNGLGVAEPNIFDSRVGDEYHIVVELAGIKDIEEAKQVVGKTIQLEFKERETEIDPTEASETKQKANDFLDQATAHPEDFEKIFEEEFEDKPKISLEKDKAVEIEGEVVEEGWKWVNDLPENFQPAGAMQPGEIYQFLTPPGESEYFVDASGTFKQREGFYVVKLLEREDDVSRTIETPEERQASHILINYEGAEMASADQTRTKAEAETVAQEVLVKAQAEGADFAELAQEHSNGPTASEGGDLGFFTIERMVPEFAGAVFNAPSLGVIPEIIETQFGFHIINYTDIKEATEETGAESRVKFARAFFSTAPDGWKETGLTGQHFRRADVGSDPTTLRPIVNIYFTQVAIAESGVNWWQLVWYLVALASGIAFCSSLIGLFFSEGREVSARRDKVVALLSVVILAGAVYGVVETRLVAPAEVIEPEIEAPEGEVAETDKAGVDLFAEITKNNLRKPLAIFLDGLPIIDTNGDGVINELDPAYAPVVQSEITNGQAVISGLRSYEEANKLTQNLNTGAIPAPVKLAGQFTVGATLGETALAQSLEAGVIGLLAVMLFMIIFYRLPGFVASLALGIYGILLVCALQVFGVVLTLAGVAGVILSVGMAVDANILIFERLKEELKLGKGLGRSVEDGFARAWSSIRDGNVSTLITCAILFWFGSSIVQGFALTLAVGVLLSMFTAITVSRNFLRAAVALVRNGWMYGVALAPESPATEEAPSTGEAPPTELN